MSTSERKIAFFLLLLLAVGSAAGTGRADTSQYNGFDVAGGLIDPLDIYHGGPERDGIPAIDRPRFLAGTAREGALDPDERVMGVNHNGIAKAYPIRILDQHEIVNDWFRDTPVTITFCPLCGTGMVFLAQVGDSTLRFGVSGLLYNSDVLLYDRSTESLWSQIMRTAVTGPMKGEQLTQIPAQHTTWGSWLKHHPESLLLSRDTGFVRDYDAEPYYDYKRLPMIMFPTVHQDLRIPGKTWVVGIELDDQALAIPFEQLDKLDGVLRLKLGENALNIHWDRESSSARAFTGAGKEIPTTSGYWFAWVAFYPQTALHNPE